MIKALQRVGFAVMSQTGSHIKLRRSVGGETKTVIVPDHRVVRKGTFHNILRHAQISLDEFLRLLK
ncbi:MAG: hypothetical protein G01um101438_751 [Parcubacteria group bacterium Gr01-1014_38]|nr:MAG: hypothetical protein G01um101438_751 [Parcubacteria group bacterium Gr01-1014_38]